jgi:hypothetical protein
MVRKGSRVRVSFRAFGGVFAACLAQPLQVGQILGPSCLLLESNKILVAHHADGEIADFRCDGGRDKPLPEGVVADPLHHVEPKRQQRRR